MVVGDDGGDTRLGGSETVMQLDNFGLVTQERRHYLGTYVPKNSNAHQTSSS